jgi:hypothetical protein
MPKCRGCANIFDGEGWSLAEPMGKGGTRGYKKKYEMYIPESISEVSVISYQTAQGHTLEYNNLHSDGYNLRY